jgi:ring-1,2-phenylacetyl-CoA epoxidase subunit PaaB
MSGPETDKPGAAGPGRRDGAAPDPGARHEWPLWEIFIRGASGLAHRHVGSLHAPDAETAIRSARDVYTRRNEGVSIWAVPAQAIAASSPSNKGPLYEPSRDKVYRHPTFFPIPDDVGPM